MGRDRGTVKPGGARVPSKPVSDPTDKVRPLLRKRQTREFTDESVSEADLTALADVARWSGSSANTQPWRSRVASMRNSTTTPQTAR